MPTTPITKLINIKVDYDKAVKDLARLRDEMDKTKKAANKLSDDLVNGAISKREYQEQYSALDQKMRSLKDGYRTVSKAVQNNIKIETQAKDSLVALRAKLSNLTREFDTMSGAARKGAEGIKKMMEINKVTNEIKEAEKATQRFYRNVGNYTSALKGLNEMTKGFRTLGGVITNVLGGFSMGKFAQNMVRVAREFEDAMARVKAVSNATNNEMDALAEKARELGRVTRYTAGEVAKGMEILARTGFTARESIEAIAPTLQLAQANTVNLAEAAQISTNVMHAFGKSVYDLSRINDVLSSTCSHSATNISELGEAMKVAAPVAHTVQIPIEETAAALGTLANVGMRGSDAGTGLKQLILALSKAYTLKNGSQVLKKYNLNITEATLKTKGLVESLKELKESGLGKSVADISVLVGKYAAPRMAALIQNVDQMVTLNSTLSNALGENARMFSQSIGTTTTALNTLQSAWESFLLDVYDSTSSYLVNPINALVSVLQFLGKEITAVGQAAVSLLATYALAPAIKKLASASVAAFGEYKAVRIAAAKEAADAEIAAETRVKITSERLRRLEKADRKATKEATEAMDRLTEARITGMTITEINTRQAAYIAAVERCGRTHDAFITAEKLAVTANTAHMKASLAAREAAFTTFGLNAKAAMLAALSGVKMLGAGLIRLAKSFAPMLILSAIFEAIQGTYRLYENMKKVEDAALDVANEVNKAKSTNTTLQQLELIQDSLEKINKKRDKSKADLNEERILMAKANGLLGTQHKTYNGINKALNEQIRTIKKAIELQTQQNIYADSYKTIMEKAAEFGIKGTNINEVYKNFISEFNKQGAMTKAYQRTAGFLGFDNLSSVIDNVIDPAYARYKAAGANMTRLERINAFGSNRESVSNIPDGDYKPTDWYKGKDKEKNLHDKYLDLYNRYKNELEQLVANSVNGQLERELANAKAALEKVRNNVEKDMAKNSPFKAIMDDTTGKIKDTEKKALEKLFDDVKIAAQAVYDRKERELIYKHNEQIYQQELEAWNARIELASEKTKEKYNAEVKAASTQNVLDQTTLEKRYMSGEFGKFKNGETDTSGYNGEANKSMWEYVKAREELDEKRESGDVDDSEYQGKLDELNTTYATEAKYYDMRYLLMANYNKKVKLLAEQHRQDMNEIQMQQLENEFAELQENFNKKYIAAGDHYKDMEFGSGQYWTEMRTRVGEEQAIQLQMQYATAQLELDQLLKRGKQGEELQEEYDAKVIAAQQKVSQAHIAANDAIVKSDEARFQAASTFIGGFITLTEELEGSDKDAAKLSKILALAQIAINTGEAISKVVNTNAAGLPYTAGQLAAGIATVMGNIASAISIVKSANFAQGGKVTGAGTGTSDSISANLSNGEYVMTAKATKIFEPLLAVMNSIGAGINLPHNGYVTQNPNQMNDFQESMKVAMAEVHPVVSVQEINRTQNRVSVIQNLDSM